MNCDLCGSNNCSYFCEITDFYVSFEKFKLYKCNECGLFFLDIDCDNYYYNKYYKKRYYSYNESFRNWGKREHIIFNSLKIEKNENIKIINILFTNILRNFVLVNIPYFVNGKILDIGCGSGKLLDVAQKVGFECYGVEPSSDARNILEKNNIKSYSSIDEISILPDNFFNIIVFSQSLEHIKDFRINVEKAVSKLEAGGVLIISVPNFACNERLCFGDFWRHLDPPRHIYHFTPETLKVMSEQLQLKIIKKKFKYHGIPKSSFVLAKKNVGKAAYFMFAKFLFSQIFSLLAGKNEKCASMMAFYFTKL